MLYPTVTNYCDALRNTKQAFRTLRCVVVHCDDAGELIYRTSSRSVRFNVTIDGVARSIRLFTARVNLSVDESCQQLRGELLVATQNGIDYYDVVIEEPFEIRGDEPNTTIEIHENRARFCRNELWGFTDANGKVVIEPIYESIDDFSESRAVVCRNGLFGLIDTEGHQIIPPTYDDLSYDGSHLCYTEIDGLFGVIDRKGRVITENKWDWTAEYCEDMLLVELCGKYGFLDQNGEIAIEIKYDDATSFDHNGYSTVTFCGKSYQIDKEEFRV